MRRLFLVPALGVVGLALASPASAQLTGRPDLNRPSYADEARQPYNESRRVAYDNGYREGIKEGERDARRRDVFNYQDERTWQRADKGYHRSFGDWQRYQQTFRTGYAAGYSDSYRRFAPDYGYRGNGGIYPNTRGGYGYPSQGGYGYPGQGGYGYPGKVVTAIPDRAATTARHSRMARTTATKRAAKTPATATHTTRCGTSGIARATTTTRARMVHGNSTRTSTGRASRKATTAATASGATGGSYQLSAVSSQLRASSLSRAAEI